MAVAVIVGNRRAHAGLLAAIFVEGCARSHGHVGEGAVVVVVVENAGRAVAGNEDVGPAVLVEIDCGYAEGVVAVGVIDVGLGGDVFKRAIAAVVIEDVLRAGQSARAAHDGNAFPDAGRPLSGRRGGREIEVHVIRDDQIEAAVAVIVDECTARAPGLGAGAVWGLP